MQILIFKAIHFPSSTRFLLGYSSSFKYMNGVTTYGVRDKSHVKFRTEDAKVQW